jgi:hypothetical protein
MIQMHGRLEFLIHLAISWSRQQPVNPRTVIKHFPENGSDYHRCEKSSEVAKRCIILTSFFLSIALHVSSSALPRSVRTIQPRAGTELQRDVN